jgi:hypothetical protein
LKAAAGLGAVILNLHNLYILIKDVPMSKREERATAILEERRDRFSFALPTPRHPCAIHKTPIH